MVSRGARAVPRGRRGDTPLIRAARFRQLDALTYLLDELHVQVDVPNRHGDTALIEGARSRDVRVVELLLRHSAEVDTS